MPLSPSVSRISLSWSVSSEALLMRTLSVSAKFVPSSVLLITPSADKIVKNPPCLLIHSSFPEGEAEISQNPPKLSSFSLLVGVPDRANASSKDLSAIFPEGPICGVSAVGVFRSSERVSRIQTRRVPSRVMDKRAVTFETVTTIVSVNTSGDVRTAIVLKDVTSTMFTWLVFLVKQAIRPLSPAVMLIGITTILETALRRTFLEKWQRPPEESQRAIEP
mmetsp:Transcript_28562/g.45495  ORF Transcript_28562/g.45495 Transcript_28562/m.45495 type:complete len:220 (+) Transcript_28562:4123-4782(+)